MTGQTGAHVQAVARKQEQTTAPAKRKPEAVLLPPIHQDPQTHQGQPIPPDPHQLHTAGRI